jgi:predicted permease
MLSITFRLLSVFLMIGIGWLARRRRMIDADTTRNLSRLLTSFFYPALIFTSMTRNFDAAGLAGHWQLPVGAFLIMVLGFGIGLLVERFLVDPHSRQGHAFLFQCTVNNYSFLPMPLALMLWGEAGVAGLIFSTLGPEVAVWTLGVYALSGRQLRRQTLRKLLNAPLLTMAATLVCILLRDAVPAGVAAAFSGPAVQGGRDAVVAALTLIGGATIPVAMIVAGSRMAELRVHHLFSRLQVSVGLLRLVIIPAAAIGLILLLPLLTDVQRILCLVAIMPSAITSVVLSELYGADSEFAASSVLITHLFSLLTIPLWLLWL